MQSINKTVYRSASANFALGDRPTRPNWKSSVNITDHVWRQHVYSLWSIVHSQNIVNLISVFRRGGISSLCYDVTQCTLAVTSPTFRDNLSAKEDMLIRVLHVWRDKRAVSTVRTGTAQVCPSNYNVPQTSWLNKFVDSTNFASSFYTEKIYTWKFTFHVSGATV
jgi:ribulose kinase